MTQERQFFSENILLSILGHLILICVMVMSFSFVIDRAKFVTPNRIQIVEVDLKNVKVSGTETILQNTNVTKSKEYVKEEKRIVEEKTTEIKDTTFVEEKQKIKEENKNAPKKKMVVKVNREVLSLDRTMTVSVVDALRVALTRCWNIDTTRTDISDIRAVAHLTMLPTGVVNKIWFESESRAQTDMAFAYVLDTIKDAIKTCQPFSMLPRNEFKNWEKIQLTFYPTQGKIM
ncbi:MAG: hypothetical protein MJ158_01675 [Alphaproteobacteria bacterium]|nr:hypothetical protein [Alphaproteobacteria bacterium]